jgi:[ribosomal protein S18]-alanine N-acetyltransferase
MPRRRPEPPAADVEPAAPIRVYPRWMIRRDMAEVLAIEHASFDYPWDEDEFLRHLRQPHYIGMVAEHGERIVGYMVYELLKGQIRVPDFATHPGFRRRGIGRQMVDKLVGKLSLHRRTRLVLSVRETNLPAQLFFRRQGFRATEILRDHHPDTGESAYLMQYALDAGPVIPAYAMEWDGTREC